MWKLLSFWVWRTTRDFSRRSAREREKNKKVRTGKNNEQGQKRGRRKKKKKKCTVVNVATNDLSVTAELDLDELSETGGVVVPDGLGVSERLEEGVGLDDLLLEDTGSGLVGGSKGTGGTGNGGEVLNNLLGVLGLSSTALTSDQKRLVLLVYLRMNAEVRHHSSLRCVQRKRGLLSSMAR